MKKNEPISNISHTVIPAYAGIHFSQKHNGSRNKSGMTRDEKIQAAKAHVIFTDDTDLPYLKILKRGFRHCFVLLNDGKNWIAFDPLASHFELTVPKVPPDFDLPRWLQGQGCITAPARIKPQKTPALPGLISCVETVKRVLGIRKLWLFTPWQLYRHLVEEEKRLTQISPPPKGEDQGGGLRCRQFAPARKPSPYSPPLGRGNQKQHKGETSWEV